MLGCGALQERGLQPGIEHYMPIITAHAEHGDPKSECTWLGLLVVGGTQWLC